jgi:hypothetical protein
MLGEEDPHQETLASMAWLASTYKNQGRWKEAEELEVRVIETRKRVLSEGHPDTLTSINNLTLTWKGQSHDKEAVMLIIKCVRISKAYTKY